MSNTIKLKRKIGGTQSAPSGGSEGEIAVFFPGVAGDTTKPTIYIHDGSGYREANPNTNITTQSINLVSSAGADIGAAYTTWYGAATGNRITGNVVIATWGTPAQAYVLTGGVANAGTASSWTSLGGAVSFAATGDITTGSDTTKAINSAALRGASRSAPTGGRGPATGDGNHFVLLDSTGAIDPGFIRQPAPAGAGGVGGDVGTVVAGIATNMFLTPAGLEMRVARTANAAPANDAGKLPALDSGGKIPAAFLPAGGLQFTGNKDLTAAYVAPTGAAAPKNGDLAFVSKAGTLGTGWSAQIVDPPASVGVGDMLVFEGGTVNKWHIMASDVDVSGLVPKAGVTAMANTARLNFSGDAPTGTNPPGIILDGGTNKGSVDNLVIDAGSY